MLERAEAAGISAVYLPAIDSTTHEMMLQTERSFPICHSMMGLHPCSVKEDFENELRIVDQFLQQRGFIAVGEIGLDFYWDKTYTEQQYTAFHKQIELAIAYNFPIVVHSRNATDECIEVVSQYAGLRGVFHCFSGNVAQAQTLMSLDFYLGIGGVLTFKNSGLDKVVQEIGLSQIVLETDAPYLSPVPIRGKRNESSYTKFVAEKLAALLNINVADVADVTTSNAKKLFQLDEKP